MYVYVYIYMYECMYVYMYVCVFIYLFIWSVDPILLVMLYDLCEAHGENGWCIWLRHCATGRKAATSIPYVVTRVCDWYNPSDAACNRNE